MVRCTQWHVLLTTKVLSKRTFTILSSMIAPDECPVSCYQSSEVPSQVFCQRLLIVCSFDHYFRVLFSL
jgi:hypothetical protein